MIALSSVFSAEALHPVDSPRHSAKVGMDVLLNDDVYSLDVGFSGEWAFCNCFSIYGDVSYRTVSYEFETMWHDQIHEKVNLQVNGFSSAIVGFKYFPVAFAGFGAHFRTPPGDGDQSDHSRLGFEGLGLWNFSKNLKLGASLEYLHYLEDEDFAWGDELGAKLSLIWKIASWEMENVFLFRHRLNESLNLSLDKDYQKMDDQYGGFKWRLSVTKYWNVQKIPLGLGAAYEMNRGTLFGFETGHRVELYFKIANM